MDQLISIKTIENKDGSIAVDGRDLHDFLEIETPYTQWFERMLEYGFDENTDFVGLSQKSEKPRGGRPQINHALSLDMAKEISMIQRNEKGKQARQYFLEMEKRAKQNVSQMSPELQFMQSIVDKLAYQERNTNRVENKVDGIAEIVGTSTMDWRKETTRLVNKIAQILGGGIEQYQQVRHDIYESVDRRGGVSLSRRLENMRNRMAGEGVSKSKRDKLTKIDVIGQDKKMIELYMAIVKEYAIKFRTWSSEY